MSLDRQLLLFMPHIVTITASSGKDNYGEDVAGATRTSAAYVEPNTVLDTNVQTNNEHKPTTVYLADLTVTPRERVTLPDGSIQRIATVRIYTEVAGLEHAEVTFE